MRDRKPRKDPSHGAKHSDMTFWKFRAPKILRPKFTQRLRKGEEFCYQTVASNLPRHQKHWARKVEEKVGKDAKLVTDTYVVRDSNEEVLVAYYPHYMAGDVVRPILLALLAFISDYPPPPPVETDIRRTDWNSLLEKCGGRGKVGMYYLATLFEQGHIEKGPCLSKDAGSSARSAPCPPDSPPAAPQPTTTSASQLNAPVHSIAPVLGPSSKSAASPYPPSTSLIPPKSH